jgi:hypothetical protein
MTIWCDNLALVNNIAKIQRSRRPTFPNETLRPSWDILQSICQHITINPTLQLQHVKGHQDATTEFDDLPLPAKLNVEADKLATSFHQTSIHADVQGPLIPGTGCQLLIDDKAITSHQRRKIRQRRGQKYLLRYIIKRHHLSADAVTQIDWDSHMRAVNSFRKQHSTFTIKFLSKWLPVGKQTHRYDPTTYSCQCPSCECPVEDFDHAFRCPERKRWQYSLRQAILKLHERRDMNPVLIDLIAEGLQHWLRETTNPPSTRFPQYDQLIESQSAIGWEQLLFGRWSQLWAYHQLEFLKRNNQPITPTNHGDGWASQIITLIWSHCHDEWLCRNQALHGKDMKTRQLARATKAQFKIRSLYDIRSQCSPYVQSHWYYGSPEEHFERETSTTNLENWIAAYETLHIFCISRTTDTAANAQSQIFCLTRHRIFCHNRHKTTKIDLCARAPLA